MNKDQNKYSFSKSFFLSVIPALAIAQSSFAVASHNGPVNKSTATKAFTGTSTGNEAWRHKPPVLPPPRPFKLAAVTSYTLPNGLSVQLLPDHRVPFITIELGINAGSVLDPKDSTGLSSMTADMLVEGTNSRSSKQIAEEVDFIGGALGAASGYDNTIISGSSLGKYAPRLLDVFSDVLLHANFPDNELKLKKTNLLQELKIKRSEPDFLLDERFSKVTFGDHPYAVVAPTEEAVRKMSRDDLQKFRSQHYLPNQSFLVIVGDFNPEEMKKLIDEKFGQVWKSSTDQHLQMPPLPKQQNRTIYLVDRPGSVQSSIKLGNISIKKTDPDYFPFLVANQVLGGATNSRLFLNIREQKGYTYGAYSSIGARKEPGAFSAEAEVRTDVTAPSLQEFLYELERLRNIKVSDKELTQAKAYLSGSFQLGLETQSGLANRLLERKLYDLPEDYLETYTDKVMAVTADQVREMARKHIDLDNIVICVVGDASKIKPELQCFGSVDTYDTEGKLLGQPTQ